jgi:hypothetical protein
LQLPWNENRVASVPDSAAQSSPLFRSKLLNPAAATSLGLVAAPQLFHHGICVFWVNAEGVVELLPLYEALADSLSEAEAVQMLEQQHSYQRNHLVSYLKGRDTRLKHTKGG